jgi:succinate dehydrogenase/fumarate reductase-like Fe-S protein
MVTKVSSREMSIRDVDVPFSMRQGITKGICPLCGEQINKDPHSVCQWQMAAEVRTLEKQERKLLT